MVLIIIPTLIVGMLCLRSYYRLRTRKLKKAASR